MRFVVGIIAFLFIFLGYLIKKRKEFNLVAGYDEKKDNPDFICKIVGFNFILSGSILAILTAISIISESLLNKKLYSISCSVVIAFIFLIIYFRKTINRLKNKEV